MALGVCEGGSVTGSGREGRFDFLGEDEGVGRSFVFSFGRLDLPEDFSVPPLRLAPPEQLAAVAAAAPGLERLARLVEWVGKGRRLDGDGDLIVSEQADLAERLGLEAELEEVVDDGSERGPFFSQVYWLTEWAAEAGFVYRRGGKLTARAAGRAIADEPLVAWRSAFDALLEMGVVDPEGNGPPWGQTVDDAIADVIVLVNTADGPVPLNEVVERVCAQEQELLEFASGDDAEMASGLVEAIAADVEVMVGALVDLGVVALEGEVLGGTPLGVWAACQLLEADGFEVPRLA